VREQWYLLMVCVRGWQGMEVGVHVHHNPYRMIWTQCISVGLFLLLKQNPNPPLVGLTLLPHSRERDQHCYEHNYHAGTS
jgi:hypothetical protein